MWGNKYRISEDLVELLTKIVHTDLKPAHGDLTVITAKTLIIQKWCLHAKLCDDMKCEQPVGGSKP
jgi:hypothetical protein